MPKLAVVPLGDVPIEYRMVVLHHAATVFGLTPEIVPLDTEPKFAYNKQRNQYHTGFFLKRLVQLVQPEDGVVLGVTMLDIFEPESEFLFCDYERENRVGVVSFARLGTDPALRTRRAQVLSVAAVGHALSLPNCDDRRCPLGPIETLDDLDRRVVDLCTRCRTRYSNMTALKA